MQMQEKEEKRRRSSRGDKTNVLMKEFKAFTVKRFGKQVSLLIIGVNETSVRVPSLTSSLMK